LAASFKFQGVMSAADGLVRNEEDGSAILSTLTILRKAGRYKLAALVPKTRPASPGSEHYRRLPPIQQPERPPHENYPTVYSLAVRQSDQQKNSGTAGTGKCRAITDSSRTRPQAGAVHRRRQPAGIQDPLALLKILTATLNERKSHETSHPLPKPAPVPQELQTHSNHPDPAGNRGDPDVSPHAGRSKTHEI